MKKRWRVGGLTMDYPIMVGAGVCKTPKSIEPYLNLDLPIGAIVTGSYTTEMREGNLERPVDYWSQKHMSGFNAYGMPNEGFMSAYEKLSVIMTQRNIVMSIAGFSPKEFVDMVRHHTLNCGQAPSISAMEANWGCPNAHDKKTFPIANDYDSMVEILEGFRDSEAGIKFPLWIKISPYLTKKDLKNIPAEIDTSFIPVVEEGFAEKVANLFSNPRYQANISAVVIANTLGNSILTVEGKPVTIPNGGKAGLSGSILKKFALRQVMVFRGLLPASIDVIASGGVLHGDDVADFLNEKVAGVQLVSLLHWFGGAKAIPKLYEESDRLLVHLY